MTTPSNQPPSAVHHWKPTVAMMIQPTWPTRPTFRHNGGSCIVISSKNDHTPAPIDQGPSIETRTHKSIHRALEISAHMPKCILQIAKPINVKPIAILSGVHCSMCLHRMFVFVKNPLRDFPRDQSHECIGTRCDGCSECFPIFARHKAHARKQDGAKKRMVTLGWLGNAYPCLPRRPG